MDRISTIVSFINSSLAGVFLQCEAFGIAERVVYGEKTAYFEKKANEVQHRVDIDDSKRSTIFHILRSMEEETDNGGGFGAMPMKTESYNMTLVVFSSNVDNLFTGKKVSDILKANMPSALQKDGRAAISARSVLINITNVNLDRNGVWADVFDGQRNNMMDSHILLSADYSVSIRVNNTCTSQLCEKV